MPAMSAAGVFIRSAARQVAQPVYANAGVKYQLRRFPVRIFGGKAQGICRFQVVYRQRTSECTARNCVSYFYSNGVGAYFL